MPAECLFAPLAFCGSLLTFPAFLAFPKAKLKRLPLS